jgi:4-hydroxy-3-methylbut-2-en-1-yl diphosphate reductase
MMVRAGALDLPIAEIVLAGPRGFCAGVERAIDIVELALDVCGPPVYVRKEIVHNPHVVETLRMKGAMFVDELHEVPDDATVIFSAHGIAPAVREEAQRRGLRVIDATCPLVTKVHLEAIRYAREHYTIVLIGHEDHDEVIGTLGEAPDRIVVIASAAEVERLEVRDPEKIAYLTQTTLSVDDTRDVIVALRKKFPKIVGPSRDDICYATQNRQAAVKTVAGDVDVLLVIGAKNSSNANRLVEVAENHGTRAYLINDVRDIRREWLERASRVGVTAGASTPEVLVSETIETLRHDGVRVREVRVVEEDVRFALPQELERMARERNIPLGGGLRPPSKSDGAAAGPSEASPRR